MKKSKTKHLVGALAVTLFSTVALQSIDAQAANVASKKTTEQSKLLASNKSADKTANFGALELDDTPDSQEVIFPDANLEKEVRKAMNFNDDEEMTVGKFRDTKVTKISMTNKAVEITDFTGMENFKYLPNNMTIRFWATFGDNVVDFSKLEGARYNDLSLGGSFKDNDVKDLMNIDTKDMESLELIGSGKYQLYEDGVQDDQLEILAPWITEMFNNSPSSFVAINLSYNSLSDFTPLDGINKDKPGWVISTGNNIRDTNKVNIVDNDNNMVEAAPVLDIYGDDISDTYNSTWNVGSGKTRDLTNLGDGKYKFEPVTIIEDTDYVSYGYYGLIYGNNTVESPSHYEKTYGEKGSSLTFKYDVMTFRDANVQDNPSITVEYVDEEGNELKESEKIDGEKIGDEFDLTENSKIDGYTLVSATDLTGEFTQDPQTITLVYKADGDTGSGGGNGGGSGGSGSGGGGSTSKPDIVNSEQYLTTFVDRDPVDLFDVNGKKVTNKQLAADSHWYSDKKMTLKDDKYYRVSTDEWIKEEDAYEYKPEKGVVRTYARATRFDYKDMINAHTEPVNRGLALGTDWKYDQVTEFNGKTYYRVATHEFVEDKHVHEYKAISGTVLVDKDVPLYDEDGESLGKVVSGNSSFKTDRAVTVNDVDYYRVSKNEYVKSTDVVFNNN